MISLLSLLFGLALLIFGAEALVRGASAVAKALKVPTVIIGLTVVAYGTSAPELAVSLRAGFVGNSDIAIGNVVGSNIFNVLFILGLSALITPLAVKSRLIRFDIPVMIGVSLLLLLLTVNRDFGRVEGASLLLGLVAYTALTFHVGRREEKSRTATTIASEPQRPLSLSVAYMLIGLLALSLGAQLFVDGAVWLAEWLGVSPLVTGLVIAAAGTSMPEGVTSIIAAIRGERDIAVGNVIGSNIFNILGVLGISSVAVPGGVVMPLSIRQFDLPVMLAAAVVCLPIAFTGRRISRWEGALFLGYYTAYVAYLLRGVEHDVLSPFNAVIIGFILSLTAFALAVAVLRYVISNRTQKS